MIIKFLQFLTLIILYYTVSVSGTYGLKQTHHFNSFFSVNDSSSVEIKSFNLELNKNIVRLKWEITPGNVKGFEVERKEDEGDFEALSFISAKISNTHKYVFTDRTTRPGNYIYRLKMVDLSGESKYSEEVQVDIVAPNKFELGQNFPNPFNPSTVISFSIAAPSHVKLTVYNVLGQEITMLFDQNLDAGVHEVTFNSSEITSELMSGVYFYRLDARGNDGTVFTSTKKMIFTK